jgi:hypothetical protein
MERLEQNRLLLTGPALQPHSKTPLMGSLSGESSIAMPKPPQGSWPCNRIGSQELLFKATHTDQIAAELER